MNNDIEEKFGELCQKMLDWINSDDSLSENIRRLDELERLCNEGLAVLNERKAFRETS